MPVVLDRADFGLWLDPKVEDKEKLQALLKPAPERGFEDPAGQQGGSTARRTMHRIASSRWSGSGRRREPVSVVGCRVVT